MTEPLRDELGVDLASVDGDKNTDWVAVKAAGVSFVVERCSWNKWADATAAHDRDAIRAAGLTYCAYMGPAISVLPGYASPEDQADVAIAGAGLIPGRDLMLVIDIEFPKGIAGTGMTRAQIAVWIGRVIARVELRLGCKPIIYVSQRVLETNDSDTLNGAANAVLSGLAGWLARYSMKTGSEAIGDDPGEKDAFSKLPDPPSTIALGDPFIGQIEGDAKHFRGFSSTVDVDRYRQLGLGSKGSRVRWIQTRVGGDFDGDFDDATEEAVARYQASSGLADTGVADFATFAKLSWIAV